MNEPTTNGAMDGAGGPVRRDLGQPRSMARRILLNRIFLLLNIRHEDPQLPLVL